MSINETIILIGFFAMMLVGIVFYAIFRQKLTIRRIDIGMYLLTCIVGILVTIGLITGNIKDLFLRIVSIQTCILAALFIMMGIVLYVIRSKIKNNRTGTTRTTIALGMFLLICIVTVYILICGNEGDSAKVIVSSLLSTFSTIIGFYFGSKNSADTDTKKLEYENPQDQQN